MGLFDLNEGLYTEAAREIYLRGDFITPRVNGIFFFDKPPLALWQSALSFHLFGVTEFAARLPVAIAATLLVLATYAFGVRYFGRKAGLLAGAMLGLNVMFYGTARQMTMDIHQSLWFGVALFCFFRGFMMRREAQGVRREDGLLITRHSSLFFLAFWAACGLGVMAKSVPGLFPIPVSFAFVVIHEQFNIRAILRRIWEAQTLLGVPLMIAIIAPWFWLAWRANGYVFYQQFWLVHHVQLARGSDFSHAQPVWYYLPALLAGFFPWSVFLPWAGVSAWRAWKTVARNPDETGALAANEARAARLFILVWAIALVLIFTCMTSKLVSYLLPMYAAAALLVGDWAANRSRQDRGVVVGTSLAASVGVVVLVGGSIAAHYLLTSPAAAHQRHDFPPAMMLFTLHAIIVGACGLLVGAAIAWRGGRSRTIAALACTMAVVIALATTEGLGAAERSINAPLHDLARDAGREIDARTPLAIYIGRPSRPSVHFYLPPQAYRGTPYAGLQEHGWFVDCGEKPPIEGFLAANRPSYILTDRRRGEELLATSTGLHIDRASADGNWLLIRADPLSLAASMPAPRPLRQLAPHPAAAHSTPILRTGG